MNAVVSALKSPYASWNWTGMIPKMGHETVYHPPAAAVRHLLRSSTEAPDNTTTTPISFVPLTWHPRGPEKSGNSSVQSLMWPSDLGTWGPS